MIKVKVRCWRVGKDNHLFVAYPEGDQGFSLICCNKCSEIYAANIAHQLYIEKDLNKTLSQTSCLKCGSAMANNWLYYPDNYIDQDGSVATFKRALTIPNIEDSQIMEFYDIYSQ